MIPPENRPQLIGRYNVIDRLGQGGMGDVYRCIDPRIGATVAIKLLRIREEGLQERFAQEARTAGTLRNHRNIVNIYDYGEHDGRPFIVMEFVEGVTLSDQIRGNFQLPLLRKLELIEELSRGLEYAHNKGIVHRDIKPANLMIDREGVLKILDFGIARVADSSLTQLGSLMGTPNYMSPEQIEGRQVDRRSDIFAVGLVIYELLSFHQAFPGDTMNRVWNAILRDAPTPLSEFCPDLDPALEAIVNRAIHKSPQERYQNLALLAADVVKVAERMTSRRSPFADQATLAMSPFPPGPGGARTPTPGTNRGALAQRRAQRIASLLPAAERALAAGDFAVALDTCEQAALLDPDDTRVIDLLAQARQGLEEQQKRAWLDEARLHLHREEIDDASALVTQVLQLDSMSTEALDLRNEIATFVRRREAEQQRQEAIRGALVRARDHLAQGNLESAIRAAGEILTQDPTHQQAHELTREALAALEARNERERQSRAAQAAVDRQRGEFAAGRRVEAIEALEAFAPPHEIVAAAVAEMRAELAEMQRLAQEEEARQLREQRDAEHRRQAQERWEARQLEFAKTAIDAGQFIDAIEVLTRLEQANPEMAGLSELLESARDGQAALEAGEQRKRDIAEKLKMAAAASAAGNLSDATALLDVVLAWSPDDPDALARRADVEAAIAERDAQALLERRAAEERARKALADRVTSLVATCRERLGAEQYDGALEVLAEAERLDPAFADLAVLRGQALDGRAEAERAALAAAARQREVAASAAAAERFLSKAELDKALAEADRALGLDAGNANVQKLRSKIEKEVERRRRAEVRERQAREELERRAREEAAARARLEEEQRRRDDEERHRREIERRVRINQVSELLTKGRQRLDAGDYEASLQAAAEADRLDPASTEVAALRSLAIAARAAAAAAREAANRQAKADEAAAQDAAKRQAKADKAAAQEAAKQQARADEALRATEAIDYQDLTAIRREQEEARGPVPASAPRSSLAIVRGLAVVFLLAGGVVIALQWSRSSRTVPPPVAAEPKRSSPEDVQKPVENPDNGPVFSTAEVPKQPPPAKPPVGPKEKEQEKGKGTTPPPPPPPPLVDLSAADLAARLQLAQNQRAQGQVQDALNTVVGGLALKSDYDPLVELLAGLFQDSERNALAERVEAVREGAGDKAPDTYRRAEAELKAAHDRGAADRSGVAVRALWHARDLFRDSAAEAKRATVITPPPPPPPPGSGGSVGAGPSIQERDGKSIRDVLAQIKAAYESRDAAAVTRVLALTPSATRGLAALFSEAKNYRLDLQEGPINFSPDGQTATITCNVTHSFDGVGGHQTNVARAQYYFSKASGTWRVTEAVNSPLRR